VSVVSLVFDGADWKAESGGECSELVFDDADWKVECSGECGEFSVL
jgi:hypothetical protein